MKQLNWWPRLMPGVKSVVVLNLILPNEPIRLQQPFLVTVRLSSPNQAINAAGVYLQYDPQALQLINLDTRASFCQLYPEKKFDNQLGTISLACGSPHPGFKGDNTLMILEFIPLIAGKTSLVTRPETNLLAADGKGTNLLKEKPTAEISILTGL
ncbi:hypothetical protein A2W24_01995 [Microgenomates group bacterium RBG_16_45_19]|nr:MAG: hypothetical protein A2W24_01995 [Microgenomates group bacterium RBG_16_45_19]